MRPSLSIRFRGCEVSIRRSELRSFGQAPLIYIDHCAIRAISSEPKWRAHLRETFQTRGTLMFSVVNMLEMARNSGPS